MTGFRLSNRHKFYLIGLLLVINAVINFKFYTQREDYLNEYNEATRQLHEAERQYQESLSLLADKQDSLQQKIRGLDSLLNQKKLNLQPIRTKVLLHAGADWSKLTDKERQAYTDQAIKHLLDSKKQ